jgi:Ca2+-binding EF-hand superfamily protein
MFQANCLFHYVHRRQLHNEGLIDVREMKAAMRALGFEVTKLAVVSMMQEVIEI